jgi:hypothetical protein
MNRVSGLWGAQIVAGPTLKKKRPTRLIGALQLPEVTACQVDRPDIDLGLPDLTRVVRQPSRTWN